MPIYHPQNLFRGINPILNSHLIAGGWHSFHTIHITDLMKLFRKSLHPLGYTADIEQSLQIRRDSTIIGTPESDVSLYDLSQAPSSPTRISGSSTERLMPILELLHLGDDEIAQPRAVGIYTYRQQPDAIGELVGWLEFLSPSNKPTGQDASYYRAKRLELLKKGLVFIELDYLHNTPPTFDTIPPYRLSRRGMADDFVGHPYRIVVMDTRPNLEDGMAKISEFDVDSPIPSITIPLNRGDSLHFNFDEAYQKTYEDGLYGDSVDYTTLPVDMTRYSPDDQARILTRLCEIRQNINFPPHPLIALPLKEAQALWETSK
jgi:hypothetical protein